MGTGKNGRQCQSGILGSASHVQAVPKSCRAQPPPLEAVTRRMWVNKASIQRISANQARPDSQRPAEHANMAPAQPYSSFSAQPPSEVGAPEMAQAAQEAHKQYFFGRGRSSDGRRRSARGTQDLETTPSLLKSPDGSGDLLSPAEELKALKQYAEGVFASHPPLLPLTGPLPRLPVADLNKHIPSIETGKWISTCGSIWRLCSYEVAEALSHYLTSRHVEDGQDEGLLNADLCLIPKPGKPPDRPNPQNGCQGPRQSGTRSPVALHCEQS